MVSRSKRPTIFVLLSIFTLTWLGIAAAQPQPSSWELKVCADQNNLPYSNEAEQGFENRIMSAVASAIEARLSYVWLPALRNTSQDLLLLRDGTCDLFLDVGNGGAPYLPTLDYYQSTYEFFYRSDAPFTVTSLDDPVLQTLRLGSAAASPASTAFAVRDLIQNNSSYYPTPPTGVTETMVKDVVNGVIDVAAAWGPEVAYYAAMQTTQLETTPVTPEIDLDGLSMVYTAAMGLRSGDTELRDLLNQGIAESWDEIQAVLQEFGVPLVPLPRPALSLVVGQAVAKGDGTSLPETVRIGVVLPIQTGDQPLGAFTSDVLGSLANQGATMALESLADAVEANGNVLKILITSAPDLPSTIRAVNRLLGPEGVSAIVGGFDGAVAAKLAELAAERGFVFMNIGAQEDALRGTQCNNNTFHIEASSSMYVDALVSYVVASGANNVFFVRTDEPEQVERMNRARRSLSEVPGAEPVIVNSFVVPLGEPNFTGAYHAISEAEPDLVIMLVDTQSQLVMLGQYETSGLSSRIIGYPEVASQTRLFYSTSAYEDPKVGSESHLSLWESAIDQFGAAELNQRYIGRFGQAMDSPAWAAFVALKLLTEAALATGSQDASDWITYLENPETTIDVYKGAGTSFRTWDHQLRQPLYLVGINPDYVDKKAYRDIAFVESELPLPGDGLNTSGHLDALGVGPQTTTCVLGQKAGH